LERRMRRSVVPAASEAAFLSSVELSVLKDKDNLALRLAAAALDPLAGLVALALEAVANPSEVASTPSPSAEVASAEVASAASPSAASPTATSEPLWEWVDSWAGSPACSE